MKQAFGLKIVKFWANEGTLFGCIWWTGLYYPHAKKVLQNLCWSTFAVLC